MDLPSPRPNIAGLTSPVQQAEMTVLLAGRWPPLKPLPVFKYETDEYRASIEFDKARGEWVCRKTLLPSNQVRELRGGLTEITMALPHGHAAIFSECGAVEQQEQELEKDASRRLQAIVEWKQNYENGALYSGLQDYLSKSQREEIADSIRLTLTARQLQFNPKNVADVFDALLKSGGKLATLLEAAQRKKAEHPAEIPTKAEAEVPNAQCHLPLEAIHPTRERRLQPRATPASVRYVALDDINGGTVLNLSETGMAVGAADPLVVADYLPHILFRLPNLEQRIKVSAHVVWLAVSKRQVGIRFVDLSAETRNQIANWIASENPSPGFESLAPAPVESLLPAIPESVPEERMGSAVTGQDQPSAPKLDAPETSRAFEHVTPEMQDASPPQFLADLPIELRRDAPGLGARPPMRGRKAEPPANRIENSASRPFVLELSRLHVAAAIFLIAVISLAVWLTAGRGPLGSRLGDTQQPSSATDNASQALLDQLRERTSRTSAPQASGTSVTPAMNPPASATAESQSETPVTQARNAEPDDPAASVALIAPSSPGTTPSIPDSGYPEASPEPRNSTDRIARNAPAPANTQPAHSPGVVAPRSGLTAIPAPRRVTPATIRAPQLSSSPAILFTGPGDGSKPFRLTLPERPIAASSTFAITSQLSVLVPPERGRVAPGEPARLQAGELVSFVWPRYSKPKDRHPRPETVKVRTTIGELGQVLDVKRVSGSLSLLPAAISAIRLWRYKPTFVNQTPVQAQQDVTIEFRPLQHLPQTPTRYPARH
jgi:PilZ domain/Gram-negative bacterial TonB protein C-terminal